MLSGIYKIVNSIDGHFYVGSSKRLEVRRKRHFSMLRSNKHVNYKLQNSFNKHGETNFHFEVLEYCLPELLIEREQHYLDTLNPFYNILIIANSSLGVKRTDEYKIKHRAALKGRSAWNKGISTGKQSPELIQKRIDGRKGYRHSAETKEILSASNRRISAERRKKVYFFSLDRELLGSFDSVNECYRQTNYCNIAYKCRTESGGYGYIWSYNDKLTKEKNIYIKSEIEKSVNSI